jgi:hypothetical protein
MLINLLIICVFCYLILYQMVYYTESLEGDGENDTSDVDPVPSKSPSTLDGIGSNPTVILETNMIHLNNRVSELQTNYLKLNTDVQQLKQSADKALQQQTDAEDLVGNEPIKINNSK